MEGPIYNVNLYSTKRRKNIVAFLLKRVEFGQFSVCALQSASHYFYKPQLIMINFLLEK